MEVRAERECPSDAADTVFPQLSRTAGAPRLRAACLPWRRQLFRWSRPSSLKSRRCLRLERPSKGGGAPTGPLGRPPPTWLFYWVVGCPPHYPVGPPTRACGGLQQPVSTGDPTTHYPVGVQVRRQLPAGTGKRSTSANAGGAPLACVSPLLPSLVELPRTFQGLHRSRDRAPLLQILPLAAELPPTWPVGIGSDITRQVTDRALILRVRLQPRCEALGSTHSGIVPPPRWRGGGNGNPQAHPLKRSSLEGPSANPVAATFPEPRRPGRRWIAARRAVLPALVLSLVACRFKGKGARGTGKQAAELRIQGRQATSDKTSDKWTRASF
ncbi:hypothetical protein KPP03845_104161 [Streptomyces xanthophaeus]|nr:hypothetical protein KPP03845_104161 [Streptomyces xanthophaeus]